MHDKNRIIFLFICMTIMLTLVGVFQSWNVALTIFNLCLISSIMSLGINIQWGNAGIVNFGVMGFAALGGLANILISMPPTNDFINRRVGVGIIIFIISIIISILIWKKTKFNNKIKYFISAFIIIFGYFLMRYFSTDLDL